MSKPTKAQVIADLQELGVEVSPEAKYDDLVKQLGELKGDVTTDSEETVDVQPERIQPVQEERLQAPASPLDKPVEDGDYLRKYQYKKQAVFGSVSSDPQPGSKAAIMKQNLLSQPKVSVIVPVKQGEDPTVKYSVTLNGYRLDLPRNVYLELPRQVAEVIMDSQNQTNAALERFKISGTAKENALL